MEVRSNLLNEVEIKGEANPVTFRNDPIEFNAGSFQGERQCGGGGFAEKIARRGSRQRRNHHGARRCKYRRLGRRENSLEANLPKIATKNLPADAVKVQVFDKKSEQATFSGIDDGRREKTINLDLKEDKKRRCAVENDRRWRRKPGGDARYEGSTTLNSFKPKRQFRYLAWAMTQTGRLH